jgi:hypothetical protein
MFRLTVTSNATCSPFVFCGNDEYIINLLFDLEAMEYCFSYHVERL